MTVAEAERTGLPLAVGCVMLMLETSGGHNVFGHDRTPLPDDRLPYRKGGPVTEATYRAYKEMRGPDGKGPGGRQGVGPTQLTWHTLQDRADALGGCWIPEINIRIGFETLAGHVRRHGVRDAFALYNTGDTYVPGPPGKPNYAEKAMDRLPHWESVVGEASR